jgi:hypothetical protein
MAARPAHGEFPILLNLPPAYKSLSPGRRAHTQPSALASQSVAVPVILSTAARQLRGRPPILLKPPPT